MLKRLLCLLGLHKWVCKINYGKLKINHNIYCERCGAIVKHDGWLGYTIVFKNGKTKDIKHLPVFELKELRGDNDEGI